MHNFLEIVLMIDGVLLAALLIVTWALLVATQPAAISAKVHDEIARTNPTIGRGAIIKLINDAVDDRVRRKMDEALEERVEIPGGDPGPLRIFDQG